MNQAQAVRAVPGALALRASTDMWCDRRSDLHRCLFRARFSAFWLRLRPTPAQPADSWGSWVAPDPDLRSRRSAVCRVSFRDAVGPGSRQRLVGSLRHRPHRRRAFVPDAAFGFPPGSASGVPEWSWTWLCLRSPCVRTSATRIALTIFACNGPGANALATPTLQIARASAHTMIQLSPRRWVEMRRRR